MREAAKAIGERDAPSEREGSQQPGAGELVREERSSERKRSDARAEHVSVLRGTRRGRPTGTHLPGDLLDAVFGGRREPTTSYDAYLRYRDQGGRARDLDLAFARALPVIREVCGSRDRSQISAAAWAIWRALREKRFTKGGRPAYWAYLRLTARGAMAHQRAADQRFRLVDRVAPEVCADGMRVTGRLPGLREVEQKMVVEKIPVLVAERVVRRLPFEGEELEAGLFFLETLLDGRDVEVRGLVDAFDVRRERLREILDYVVVAARMALWRIRAEIRAAAGADVGWQGALSMSAWLYGEDEEGGRGD